jgi:hypothetical protein
MITRPARKALRVKREIARGDRRDSAYWEGYWNDNEQDNPYANDTARNADWQRGRDDRNAE